MRWTLNLSTGRSVTYPFGHLTLSLVMLQAAPLHAKYHRSTCIERLKDPTRHNTVAFVQSQGQTMQNERLAWLISWIMQIRLYTRVHAN